MYIDLQEPLQPLIHIYELETLYKIIEEHARSKLKIFAFTYLVYCKSL